MPLTDYTQPVAHVAQATAVVVGGTWAYMKFLKGRTFRHRAEVSVTASMHRTDDDILIHAHVSMHNHGLARIKFQDRRQCIVFVDVLSHDAWSQAREMQANVPWNEDQPAMTTPLFARHGWIEPNETIKEELLIRVASPSDALPPLAYQVRVWIRVPHRWRRRGTTWTANSIVAHELSDWHSGGQIPVLEKVADKQ